MPPRSSAVPGHYPLPYSYRSATMGSTLVGPPGRDVTRQERHSGEQQRNEQIRRPVVGLDIVEQARQDPSHGKAASRAGAHSHRS